MVCNHGIYSSYSLVLCVRDSGSLSPHELNIASDINIMIGILIWSLKNGILVYLLGSSQHFDFNHNT